MKDSPLVQAFWNDYLATFSLDQKNRFSTIPEAWSFGNDKRLADQLVKLVILGKKTATCSRHLGGKLPEEGELSIILDGDDSPQCVVETLEVAIRRFCDVDSEFAADEGEGDRSLEHWRRAHWEFFTKEGEIEGYLVSEEMPLVCERFRVVYANPKAPST